MSKLNIFVDIDVAEEHCTAPDMPAGIYTLSCYGQMFYADDSGIYEEVDDPEIETIVLAIADEYDWNAALLKMRGKFYKNT